MAQAMAQSAPQQPVPYSHKLHAGDLKLKCATCHPNPDPGETMTLPKPSVCGQCHAGKYDREIKWVRVYEIPITYDGRGYDEGKKITWRDGLVALGVLLKYRFTE